MKTKIETRDYFCIKCGNDHFIIGKTFIDINDEGFHFDTQCWRCNECEYELMDSDQMNIARMTLLNAKINFYERKVANFEDTASKLAIAKQKKRALEQAIQANQEKQGNNALVSKNDREAPASHKSVDV